MGAMHGRRTAVRCTGCGRKGDPLVTFECTWPDGEMSVERFCAECRLMWQGQLVGLGATFHRSDETPDPSPTTVDGIRAIADYHQEMADRWRRVLDLVTDGAQSAG